MSADATAMDRLTAWAQLSFKHKVTVWCAASYKSSLLLWVAEAEDATGPMTIRVETNPLLDPETACQTVIARLAEAGVVVP